MVHPSRVPGVLGNTGLHDFDAIIVGSGAGGAAAARVLTTNGRRVLVFEAGDNNFPGLEGRVTGMFDPTGLMLTDPIPHPPRGISAGDRSENRGATS